MVSLSVGILSSADTVAEVLTHVLSHLPPEYLSMMSLVNQRLHKLITTPPAWRIAFARYFPGAESTGLVTSVSTDDGIQRANKRSFTRVSALASWRSEYILRTRLLRSLARGRPAVTSHAIAPSSRHKAAATATIMYSSKLMYPVSHIHANFGSGLNKKQPLFVHGAVEQGAVSSSDPGVGAVGNWGLADFEAFRHFADIYTGEAEYGLGTGDIVGMPNVMDISQAFGKLYGEACPGGRLFYTGTTEQRGRFLYPALTTRDHALGIPEISNVEDAITSVWLAKSESILKATSGILGMLAGTACGVLSAYAVGMSPVYDRRYERGELTARWVICPGIPIIAIDVDEQVSSCRIGRQRLYAVVLNALGEVFYLTDVPVRNDSRAKLHSPADVDRVAWQTGRSVEWQLLESTRRVARPDPFQLNTVDGSYSPKSSSDKQGLDHEQLRSEARELEAFLRHRPRHYRTLCASWDMRRALLVDYGGENSDGGGEAIVVVNKGYEESTSASIKRFTRHRSRIEEPTFQYSGADTPRSRTSSTDSAIDTSFQTIWHQSDMSFGYLKTTQISAITMDCSDFAVLALNEDPLLGMSGGSDVSSASMSPFGTLNLVRNASEIPGQRARLFAVGTNNGIVLVFNIRATDSPAADMVNTVLSERIIYTKSPQISSLALTSLFLVHGGNDGLVQAWDPLASTSEPVRTLNSRFSDRARRRIAQAEQSVHGVGNNYYAAGAIVLDPDPTVLRGMVSLGTHLRYWSYNAGTVDAYKSRKRGQLRRRSDRGNTLSNEQKYHHTGRGVLRDHISDERFELEREKMNKKKETERLTSRFGTDLLGEGASEEEMLAYATMLSEESYATNGDKKRVSPPQSADADIEEAIRLSMLESTAQVAQAGPSTDDDLEFVLQLSLAEQESRAAYQDDFPVLEEAVYEGKGKGRKL